MTMKQKQKNRSGVSILELLTVLAIIVTLIGVTLVEFSRVDDKAVRSASLVTLKGFAQALKMYKTDKGSYSCSLNDLLPYANITAMKNSFGAPPLVATDDCTFKAFTYLRLSAIIKGITPTYTVRYNLVPQQDPECSTDGSTFYPCSSKW